MSDLEIVKLVAGGEGLGFLEGKAVFVPGVLPGERVRVRVAQRRRDFDRADLLEIVEASPHRVSPLCRYAGVCGGCDWQHIAYEEQLRLKASVVTETMRRTGGIAIEPPGIEPSAPWEARNRAQVHRDPQGRLGYMAARSARVVAVDSCPIVIPSLARIFQAEAGHFEGLDRFTVFAAGEWVAVEGRDDARDLTARVCGRDFLFSVGCFFQSNLGMLERLVPWAVAGLAGQAAADLYCGVGLFGSFMSDRFSRIIFVESRAMSLGYARRNAPGDAHEFHPMAVEQWISSGAARKRIDAVVLDPPRAGLAAEVRDWLIACPPARVVYVSCNPVTLARDLRQLVAGGFVLDELRLFDLYPQTSHIEAVARLSAGGG